mmetsp:Transcript_39910/g.97036  ORF Transcript_39910/g.97036 Transcript_39910/m.97036 type:complete len:323 (-) Transcript_39910:259-1227(-)
MVLVSYPRPTHVAVAVLLDVHPQQAASHPRGPRLAEFLDAGGASMVGYVDDDTAVLLHKLYPEHPLLLGPRGVAQQSVLVQQPARPLDVLHARVLRHVANVDLGRQHSRLVDERVPPQLPLCHPPVELQRPPHVVHARVDVLHRAVLRVPQPLRAVVRLPLCPLVLDRTHPPRILGHLPVVRHPVKVLLDVVRLLDVHRGDRCGPRLVHLAPLQLPDLLDVGLVLPPHKVRWPNPTWRYLANHRLASVLLRVLDGSMVGALHSPSHGLAGELVDVLVRGRLPDPLAVLDVCIDNLGIACIRMSNAPVHVPPHEIRWLLVEGR